MPDTDSRVVSRVEFRVRYAETDQMGVVYHAHYLVWCEIGRTDFIRMLGTSYASMERGGSRLAVADASLRYHAPARYDDLIGVETTLAEARSRAITFDYLIRNAETGVRLVTARTTLVCIDSQGRPVALPPTVRETLERAVS
jgi:acyl-CoA thioester hydrolase